MAGSFQPVRADRPGAAIMLMCYTMKWRAALKTQDAQEGEKLSRCWVE